MVMVFPSTLIRSPPFFSQVMSAPSLITCPLDALFTASCRPLQSLTETVVPPSAEAVNGMPASMLRTITMVSSALKNRLFFMSPLLLSVL